VSISLYCILVDNLLSYFVSISLYCILVDNLLSFFLCPLVYAEPRQFF